MPVIWVAGIGAVALAAWQTSEALGEVNKLAKWAALGAGVYLAGRLVKAW